MEWDDVKNCMIRVDFITVLSFFFLCCFFILLFYLLPCVDCNKIRICSALRFNKMISVGTYFPLFSYLGDFRAQIDEGFFSLLLIFSNVFSGFFRSA